MNGSGRRARGSVFAVRGSRFTVRPFAVWRIGVWRIVERRIAGRGYRYALIALVKACPHRQSGGGDSGSASGFDYRPDPRPRQWIYPSRFSKLL